MIQSMNSFSLQRIIPTPIIPRPSRRVLVSNQEKFIRSIREKGKTSGFCLLITGEWSCGKTLFSTMLAVERSADGIPIIANYRLKDIPDFYFLTDIELIKEIKQCILIIDEFRRYADCYLSSGQKARFVSNLVSDLGKQSVDFYITDQHYNAPPPRVKTNVRMYAYPQYDEISEWCTVYLFKDVESYIMLTPFFYFGFYAPDYWDYYDTRYKVEDYKIKFDPKRYAYTYMVWLTKEKNFDLSKDSLNYWNLVEGMELSSAKELNAVWLYIKNYFKKKKIEDEKGVEDIEFSW